VLVITRPLVEGAIVKAETLLAARAAKIIDLNYTPICVRKTQKSNQESLCEIYDDSCTERKDSELLTVDHLSSQQWPKHSMPEVSPTKTQKREKLIETS